MKKGKLIVIDGVDGSGKSTQIELVEKAMLKEGKKVKTISFPTYTKSSALIDMYLAGEFGEYADDVNAYAASTFYAVDRYASFKKDWKTDYENGATILTARYTTSNAIHQGGKLVGEERDRYLKWLEEFEYGYIGLPKPDAVIFLDMPVDKAEQLLANRYNNDESKKDVHEKDEKYLWKCYNTALEITKKLGWIRISCVDGERIKSKEEICIEIKNMIEGIE